MDYTRISNNWSEIEDKILKELLFEENPELFEKEADFRNFKDFCDENEGNSFKNENSKELFTDFFISDENSHEIFLEKKEFFSEKALFSEKNQEKPQISSEIDQNPAFPEKKKIKWSFIAMKMNQRANLEATGQKLGKHCRERWFNHLSPKLLKTEWTDAEDVFLLEMALKYSRKWAKISRNFPGRTQHSVKNRYLSLIAREFKISRKKLTNKLIKNRLLGENALFNIKRNNEGKSENFWKNENFFQMRKNSEKTMSSLTFGSYDGKDEKNEGNERKNEDFSPFDEENQEFSYEKIVENQGIYEDFGFY